MCQNATLGDIARQQEEKLRISLSERFITPTELLAHYYKFYANAEPLIKPCKISSKMDTVTKALFSERKKQYSDALHKVNTTYSYDDKTNVFSVRFSKCDIKQAIDNGGYLLNIGKKGEVIGIDIFNVKL